MYMESKEDVKTTKWQSQIKLFFVNVLYAVLFQSVFYALHLPMIFCFPWPICFFSCARLINKVMFFKKKLQVKRLEAIQID